MSRIVVNYCKDIVDNYSGYLTGKDITYTSTEDISNIQDILNYNDVSAEDKDLLLNALIHGIAYEQCWIDEDGQQRFATLDPCEVIPVYYNDLEQKLACVIRYYNLSNTTDGLNNTRIEVYYDDRVEIYTSGPSFASLELIEVLPNYYNQIPITVLPLNKNHESIFAQIISLQDAYNDLISSEADNWSSFVDAYLVIEGMNADEEDIAMMKENRVLLNSHKVYVSRAYGERDAFPYRVIGNPFYGEPMSCCAETYLVIGPYGSKVEAENAMSYIRTRFFRFLVLLVKNTQDAPKRVYQFVPMQDFSKPWTDAELYAKYKLTKDEIAFIESMIKPLE